MNEVSCRRFELQAIAGWLAFGLLLASPAPSRSGQTAASPERFATLIKLSGPIGPAMSRYVEQSLVEAGKQGSSVAILQIDTPGGLDASMRDIIKSILASPVPVVAYVAPSGARAASAGTYILYASHLAAMAPATPPGLQRIRYYGLLGNRHRQEKLEQCRQLLQMPAPTKIEPDPPRDYRDRYEELTGVSLHRCPVCQRGRMLTFERFDMPSPLPVTLDTS